MVKLVLVSVTPPPRMEDSPAEGWRKVSNFHVFPEGRSGCLANARGNMVQRLLGLMRIPRSRAKACPLGRGGASWSITPLW